VVYDVDLVFIINAFEEWVPNFWNIYMYWSLIASYSSQSSSFEFRHFHYIENIGLICVSWPKSDKEEDGDWPI
jgi:hypothetical protein